MITLRTVTLPLLVAATLGLSACGDGGDAKSTVEPTSPAVQAVQDEAAAYERNIADERAELEQIAADVKSGKITERKGRARTEKVTKDLEERTADLAGQVEEAAKASGDEVTELDLGGDAGETSK